MKLLVFGATGATGQQVMEQALARGHQVTAVARRPEAITFAAPHLRVVQGDVTQLTSFQHHLAGQDVVVAALGTRGSAAATTLYSVGAANVLQAMQQHRVRRLLTVTAGAYVQDEADPPLVRLVVKPLLTTVLGAVYEDMQRMEKLVRASRSDWTIVQPARLTDGPRTGRYRAVIGGSVPNGWQIARADVADYILTHVDTPDAYRATVALAY